MVYLISMVIVPFTILHGFCDLLTFRYPLCGQWSRSSSRDLCKNTRMGFQHPFRNAGTRQKKNKRKNSQDEKRILSLFFHMRSEMCVYKHKHTALCKRPSDNFLISYLCAFIVQSQEKMVLNCDWGRTPLVTRSVEH